MRTVSCGRACTRRSNPPATSMLLGKLLMDGANTLVLARTTDAILLTLGLTMTGVPGLDLIPLIKIENPVLRILVVTMHAEESFATRAFKAGASGCITKDCWPWT